MTLVVLSLVLAGVLGLCQCGVVEKRELSASASGPYTTIYSSYSDPSGQGLSERQAGGAYAQSYSSPPSYGGNQISTYASPSGPPPPYGFKDPGFSVQTGFEGFLVPNPWYGLLPWGAEGIVIAVIGIVVVLAALSGLGFLLFKVFKIGKLLKEDEEEVRSYIPSLFSQENLNYLTSNFYDALDKYNELITTSEGKSD